MIREPAENIVNKKLGKKLIVIEPPDCKNPEEYDKNQAYKVAMKLKKHLRQRIFQQLDFEQKHKSGSVDIDAIRSQVAKCGRITNNAVFQRKNFYTRGGEWVVEVLIDLSGSMKGKMGDAKQALATLGYAFDGLPNVHYALTGFTTTPEQGVVEVHIKNHTDRRMNIKRVDKLDAMCGNADGVNIRSACIRLLRRKNMKRLLVVISDGEPAGPFFEARGSSVEDVRQAVKFAEHYGVKVVGIGIPEIEPVAMKKMYKNWICFDKTDGIYKSIGKLIVEALE
jgi:nitric oxide reductase activation protein